MPKNNEQLESIVILLCVIKHGYPFGDTYCNSFLPTLSLSHGTFTCVPMGKFLKIPVHVPWFIRLGRECGKSGDFAHVP